MINFQLQQIQELGQAATLAMNSGDLIAAESKLLQVLEIDPAEFNALSLLAYLRATMKDFPSCIHYLELARKIRPLDQSVLINLGKAYLDMGNYQKSIGVYTVHKEHYEFNPDIALDLVIANCNLRNFLVALEQCIEITKKDTKNLAAWKQLSIIYLKLKRIRESKDAAKTALCLDPNDAEGWIVLGNAEYDLGEINNAISSYKRAVDIKPNSSISWTNIGNCFLKLGNYDQAIKFFLHSIRLESNSEAFYNLGVAYGRVGDFAKALIAYNRLLEIDPQHVQGQLNKGLALLQLGNFEEGWVLYENRFKLGDRLKSRYSNIKRLESLKDAVGKKLLVWYEQGMGDTLQFSRYIQLLEEKGVVVTFEAQAPLYDFLKNQFECCVVDESINTKEFDYQIPLLSLPLIFKTTLDTIPGVTNVSPEISKVQFWKEKVKRSRNKRNIGLAVSGNSLHQDDAIRSMPLHFIGPLLDKANIFLLQKEVRNEDQEFLKNNPAIINLGVDLVSFSDSAAVIENLDLVISVDTSLIHLAGVMGKESYLLLPKIPEWRWLLGRKDTPWYKGITLIEQNEFGDWRSVVKQLINKISNMN